MRKELLPPETVIYYSAFNLLSYLVISSILAACSVHFLWTVRPLGVGAPFLFLIGVGSFLVIGRQLWLLTHNRPQLTISQRGIQLGTAPGEAWQTIQHEEVRRVRRGRGTDTVLYYQAGGKVRELSIRELAITAAQLTHLLHEYRAQSQEAGHRYPRRIKEPDNSNPF